MHHTPTLFPPPSLTAVLGNFDDMHGWLLQDSL